MTLKGCTNTLLITILRRLTRRDNSTIPKYITSNVQKIAGSQAENTIVLNTSEDPKTLFVYKYFWSNKEKIQSAWMKFTFDT